MTAFSSPIRPDDVGELIDLDIEGDPATQSMASLQREGVAALYNILCRRSFAYLADEVGMGKTYQALGLAALLWNEKPNARILFISPRENLQQKWFDEYRRFFSSNYRRRLRIGDDRVTSVLFGEPVHRPVLYPNLRSWTPALSLPGRSAAFLRHTSFTRPVHVRAAELSDTAQLRERVRSQFNSWGLFDIEVPRRLRAETASWELNLAFARAVNARLAAEGNAEPFFDLVIVDEAQCLRNPANQTNRVFHGALGGQGAKWVFMSATPAHGGPGDIATVLNHYPDAGEVLESGLSEDLPALQAALQPFMVRRQRSYRTQPGGTFVQKSQYRTHATDDWSVKDDAMGALGTLAMGLIQKELVQVLRGRSNRYRIGFLSSFESLQASLGRGGGSGSGCEETDDGAGEGDGAGEWYTSQADGSGEAEAPDAERILRLTSDFERRFGRPLPHPKLDAVAAAVAPDAFGDESHVGGEKFLIFTRRVSTVAALRDRLHEAYLRAVEERMHRVWGAEVPWASTSFPEEDAQGEGAADPEGTLPTPGDDRLRRAMAPGGFLFRFRQTFRDTGRHATFFDDGWLPRLCAAGGRDPGEAARALPEALWRESWTHASRPSGKTRTQHRADRIRYIALHALRDSPEVFGLSSGCARPFLRAYEACLHAHVERAQPADEPHVDAALFTRGTLWTAWDEAFSGTALALPGGNPRESGLDGQTLCKRQVARTVLAQTLRLGDAILDLYFADQAAGGGDAIASRFLSYLQGDDPAAAQLRRDCTHWLSHLRLIVDSCLEGAGRSWSELAQHEFWPQLNSPSAVIGVTGGSGAHRTATQQFRTPSLPRVVVCTDTLKEGVDMHLFCDRVLHYGVAWTSGDLEQRVGRVDRFFSQIERRLHGEGPPPGVNLHVGYPHVHVSLERQQVERVIQRQREAERLLDSLLAGTGQDARELTVGGAALRPRASSVGPFAAPVFPKAGRNTVAVARASARAVRAHYLRWYEVLRTRLAAAGWRITPDMPDPPRSITLSREDRPGQHEVQWRFDAALGCYILQLVDPPWPAGDDFTGGRRRRVVERRRHHERFVSAIVPTPEQGADTAVIERLLATLGGEAPRASQAGAAAWGPALVEAAGDKVEWSSEHKAKATITRGDRAHTISLYAYEGGVRLVGTVSDVGALAHRDAWGGEPTVDRVTTWCLDTTAELPLGYLDVHSRDGLVFGVHVLHGELSVGARVRLVQEAAWRADLWEASLTGVDRW